MWLLDINPVNSKAAAATGRGPAPIQLQPQRLRKTIQLDPERNEIQALFAIAGDFKGKRVLEIGCGDGRLTWRYAEQAAHVVGIDPGTEAIASAQENTPLSLSSQIEFHALGLEEFAEYWITHPGAGRFDLALLSWSL